MVTDSQCSYSCNTILVVANLLLSASLSKHPMDVYSYATEEHRDFKSLYKNVADCKSATTDMIFSTMIFIYLLELELKTIKLLMWL